MGLSSLGDEQTLFSLPDLKTHLLCLFQWRRPRPISGLLHTIIPGCNSTEKDKQKEREQGVLQAIFFTRAS